MSNNKERVYAVSEDGFISTSYWDKTVHYKTLDENGVEVDCYSKVVDEIDRKTNEVSMYYKKEKRKNFLINMAFKSQLVFLLLNVIVTFMSVIIYHIVIINGYTRLGYNVQDFFQKKLGEGVYTSLCGIVNPVIKYVNRYGLENFFNYLLLVLSITTFIALIIYMIGRDHITIRWFARLLHIRPICDIKSDSDKRINRLSSDLYSIQLRRHEVKYASHK